MTLEYKFSNNSGKAINLFIPGGLYYKVSFSCPDSNSMGVESYHPKNQQVFFGNKEEILSHSEKNIFFSEKNGITIIFTPEENKESIKSNFFHGYYTVEGFYEDEHRKTKDITEKFHSMLPRY